MMVREESADEAKEDQQQLVGQLRWRTRRGLRELDLILQRYLKERYPSASVADQAAFFQLLEQNDADILDWLLGRTEPPPNMANVVAALSPRR